MKQVFDLKFRDFDKAREFSRSLKLKNRKEWDEWCKKNIKSKIYEPLIETMKPTRLPLPKKNRISEFFLKVQKKCKKSAKKSAKNGKNVLIFLVFMTKKKPNRSCQFP